MRKPFGSNQSVPLLASRSASPQPPFSGCHEKARLLTSNHSSASRSASNVDIVMRVTEESPVSGRREAGVAGGAWAHRRQQAVFAERRVAVGLPAALDQLVQPHHILGSHDLTDLLGRV